MHISLYIYVCHIIKMNLKCLKCKCFFSERSTNIRSCVFCKLFCVHSYDPYSTKDAKIDKDWENLGVKASTFLTGWVYLSRVEWKDINEEKRKKTENRSKFFPLYKTEFLMFISISVLVWSRINVYTVARGMGIFEFLTVGSGSFGYES